MASRKSEESTAQQWDQGGYIFGIPDHAHQFTRKDGFGSSLEPVDIVVGVDFGTSSTKVVIQAPRYAGNPAFAVPFGALTQASLEYLLPTRLFISNEGRCSLTFLPGASILTDIKLSLMRDPLHTTTSASEPSCEASATAIATAYLALVLRYARCWFIANKEDIFGEFPLVWSFNLGLPAAIDDNVELRKNFTTAGQAAWLVSIRHGPITLDAAQGAINDIKRSGIEVECDFALVPEVIAEVKGYAESRFRSAGLHLLVDVGASTVDVCSFNLRVEEGDAPLPIITADIDLLGATRLHLARIDGAKEAAIVHGTQLVDESNPSDVIPDNIMLYVPPDQQIHDEITAAQRSFKEACERLLRKTILDLRRLRDPNSPRFSERLPVFICGGAKDMQPYREVVRGVDEWLSKLIVSSHGIRQINLPKPDSLEAQIDDNSYHRLAVAWGLSHDSFNIGTYSRPSEIGDIPPPKRRNFYDAFISKDMV